MNLKNVEHFEGDNMCNFTDEIDKMWKCKFSEECSEVIYPKELSDFNPNKKYPERKFYVCAFAPSRISCKGESPDRFRCPRWCQVYHDNKCIQ